LIHGQEEGWKEEGHEEEGCEEEEVRKTIWTWHVLWGLVGCTRRPVPDFFCASSPAGAGA
jgi:hypothetical protein